MKTPVSANERTATQKICLTALFAALTCAGTLIIVPMPIGYFNLGDIILLCAAWSLGPMLGISAAVGAALADVLSGYIIYAPATLVIKAAMVVCAALLHSALHHLPGKHVLRIVSSAAAELIMIAGYFLYDAAFLGYGMGAAASIPGNALQALCGVIGGTALMATLTANKRIAQFLRLH